jgi:hypothetical protein
VPLFVALGCQAEPLPPDKADYAGHWRAPGVDLVIDPGGQVEYTKKQGAGYVEISGPIKTYDGDDFVVGVMVMTTRFDVTAPPRLEGGVWTMTVDGTRLVRVDD